MSNTTLPNQSRMLSIDFFRGFTMFMLIGEFSGFFGTLVHPSLNGTFVSAIGQQLEHAEWVGLHFWDLIQPFFMFIVGVAMPFSMTRRWNRGDSWNKTFVHVLIRSFFLLFFGWALYCIGPGKITWHFTNVLAQLSVTYLIAFLIMRKAVKWQLLVSFILIVLSDLLYRFWNVEGFNQPFTPDHNFGSWFDLALTGSLADGHWVAFNAMATTAHTIWGVIAGMILMNDWKPRKKIQTIAIAGIIGVVFGYILGIYIPIIKHICTSSFVVVSGGWCLAALAFSYWLIDVKKYQKFAVFFAIVGMNPLFIYLFAHTNGIRWLYDIAKPFINALFGIFSDLTIQMALTFTVWVMMWGICYFLYKNKVFIRL